MCRPKASFRVTNEMADKWDEVFDVVIAGTGAGGLSPAVICANRGARVLGASVSSRPGFLKHRSIDWDAGPVAGRIGR
ncbi:hypothetical protein FBY31_4640 [Arthrobacter sp. SLBN-100]|nr:hypothetical protein FBY31_4640 [Arthrobacter sp. SLBN-100]